MENLDIIEGNYNAHVNAYERAFDNKNDYYMAYEDGYLSAIEYLLQQLGVDYETDTGGYITIKDGRN